MSSTTILRLTVAMACVVGLYQAFVFHLGSQTSPGFEKVWSCVFAGLLAFWVDEDSKDRKETVRPSFDIGLFIYLVWIVYLPYYLLKTRGRSGWLWLAGLVLVVFLGTVLQWVVYAAS
jgi:hypothetical protein